MVKISRLIAFFTLTLMFLVFNVSFAASCGGSCPGKKSCEGHQKPHTYNNGNCQCLRSAECEKGGGGVSPVGDSSDDTDKANPGDRKIIIHRPKPKR